MTPTPEFVTNFSDVATHLGTAATNDPSAMIILAGAVLVGLAVYAVWRSRHAVV